MEFRAEKISKWIVIIAIIVAFLFAIRSIGFRGDTLIAFIHRMSTLSRQARINALLRKSLLLEVNKVVEYLPREPLMKGVGYKRVEVYFQLSCQKSLPFSVTPECFTLVDSSWNTYYPLITSPLFVKKGENFWLQEGEEISSSLLFEIPETAKPCRLRFNQPR